MLPLRKPAGNPFGRGCDVRQQPHRREAQKDWLLAARGGRGGNRIRLHVQAACKPAIRLMLAFVSLAEGLQEKRERYEQSEREERLA
jgi:hypothetical protein